MLVDDNYINIEALEGIIKLIKINGVNLFTFSYLMPIKALNVFK